MKNSDLLKFPKNMLAGLYSSTIRTVFSSQFVRERLYIALLF